MKSKAIVTLLIIAVAGLTNCGGGSGKGGGVVTPTSTITSVSATCSPASVQVGAKSTCTATVEGTGSFSSGVAWSETPSGVGTVNADGVFTSTNTGTATITATSTQDPTKSGSSRVTVTSAPPPPPTGTVTANPTNITLGQSATITMESSGATQCTGTGSWSGSVPCNGATQVTPTTVGLQTYGVTFTGPGGSVNGSATVTVSAGILISSISPNTTFCSPTLCIDAPVETFNGIGFAPGELLFGSGYPGGIPLPSGVGSTQFQQLIDIGGQYYRPRFIDFWLTSSDGSIKSNTVAFAFYGSAPLADASANNIFVENPADGNIYKFNMDGTFVTSFPSGSGHFVDNGIAVDDSTGTVKVVTASQQGFGWTDENGNGGGGIPGDGAYIYGLAAADNVGCTTEPTVGHAWCAPLATGQGVAQFYTAGVQPQAQGKAPSSACGESDVFTFDAQGLTSGTVIGPALYKHLIASDGTATLRGSVALPEFTPASAFGQSAQYVANWYVVVLPNCKVGVMGPVLNSGDGTVTYVLSIVDGTSLQEVVPGGVALAANSWKVFPDKVNGNFIASSVDLTGSQGVNDLTKVDPLGNSTKLSSNSPILGVGAGVKPDGTIYFAGWDPLNDMPAPQVRTLPNN